MIHIIWGVLNIAILFYFFFICIRSVKLIREKLGFFATLVFILGILSFMAVRENRDTQTETIDLRNPEISNRELQGNVHGTEVQLEKDLGTEIQLEIVHRENPAGRTLRSATASRSGFVGGTNWRVTSISVDKAADSIAYRYDVSGILDWKILGITIYSQKKHFSGKTDLKH